MFLLVFFISVLATLVTVIYLYFQYLSTYWERRGFKTLKPIFPFGHVRDTILLQKSIGETMQDIYNKATNEPYIGIFVTIRPLLVVRDPDLIQRILIKDFEHFVDRGFHVDEENDPISANLLNLSGQQWKKLRGMLTPTFTTGKLKSMLPTMVDCGTRLERFLANESELGHTIEAREIAARYATDIIASVAFGIEINSIDEPDNDFRRNGRNVLAPTLANGIRLLVNFLYPSLAKYVKIRTIAKDIEDFMSSVVKQNLEYREKKDVRRKDFFQLLVQLRNTGEVQLDDQWDTVIKIDESQKQLTLNEVTANAFLFYVAGFETSSTTLSFTLYELAKNPDVQEKLYEEIDRVLKKYDGKITYECVSEMTYLECCIDEILRKYPPGSIIIRQCTKEYSIPGTDVTLEKGVGVFIPVYALHNDEKYFSEPEKFIPERFSEENSRGKTFAERPYLPFGDGPRNCIGMRLGKLQTKLGLVIMLKKFRYELSEKLVNKKLVFSPRILITSPLDAIDLRVIKR